MPDFRKNQALYDYLSGYLTEHRKEGILSVLSERTRYLTVILDNIFQSQNASAVMRSCECLGVQDLYVIEESTRYKVNKNVVMGASKWVDLHRFSTTKEALSAVKKKGYKIAATSPGQSSISLHDLPLDHKIALVFGNELNGISQEVFDEVDYTVTIPMCGFTESFNISVSAGISLYYLMNKLKDSEVDWKLTEEEILDLKVRWARTSIKKIDIIEKEFNKKFS
ncbi:TrmH family RNA methyltransferase [Flexithrix dorotheae]|uniref:TrmH family RNA methyltransferase n=1 Tax=Flexithrix dorotheae TaxID=70993 RepID=UPI000382C3CE|nr:RNA methyltransferase [Flexithrix dorotheae]